MTRLARALGIRTGEGRIVALVAALFAAIEAARGFGEIGVDTLVISRFGAGSLPWLFIGLGLVSLVAALGYGAALGRLRRNRLLVGLLVTAAALLVLGQVAVAMGAEAALPAVWIGVYAAGTIAVTVAWTVAGAVLDVRQAKRLFPIATSAAIAGSFAGTLAAGPTARLLGTEWLIGLEAALLAVAAATIARVGRDAAGGRLRAPATGESIGAALRAGWDEVRRRPLLRLIGVAYVLFSILMFSVTFPFLRAMSEAFPDEADLATALGFLSAGVTLTSFVVSLVIAPRVYRRFGVATAAVVLPAVYVVGFGLWLVQFSAATAALVRFVQQVTQRGLTNAAWGAFYNVVPAERRAQVLAFNDGVPGQVGIALSGGLLLAAGTLLARDQVFWLGLGAAVLCLIVVVAIRRAYARTLVETLRTGLGEQILEGGPGLAALAADPQVEGSLVAVLSAPEPAARSAAADLLGRIGGEAAKGALAERAGDEDAGVRAAVLGALAALGPPGRLPGAAALLGDPDPAVRRAAVRAAAVLEPAALSDAVPRLADDASPGVRSALAVALVRRGDEDLPHRLLAELLEADDVPSRIEGLVAVSALGGHTPSDRIAEHLHDPAPAVRMAAIHAIAALDPFVDPTPAFLAALDDGSRAVRRAAADALRERGTPPDALLAVLRDGSTETQEAALWALDGRGQAVREELLAWARAQVARAVELRSHRAALDADAGAPGEGSRARGAGTPEDGSGERGVGGVAGSRPAGTGRDFLAFLLGRREDAIVDRLLQAIAVLGAPEAGGLIRRCLRSNDLETRAQAVEALDSIGDAGLRRSVVALLEAQPAATALGEVDVLRRLGDDPDRWIRALALRARADRLSDEWSELENLARTDPDPIVGDALGTLFSHGGSRMPETSPTVGSLDRMLFLRRVPLFGELAPEDLQRIAASARERYYPAGTALVREGELGDELVVVVEGSVRVVRVQADGGERLLRRYGPGDHIGELAVLRARPRAATVIAEEPGVRGLVIGGEGVMALLRERPEAAFAMLATLAERISTQ